ncbi:Protein of unknown function [Pyronema omphalodes CBS 100304]|uniref:Uncharacterized protein n=1 Tax=Pyronema omphalodes (strain CBS 100304) TaxID=1076935 RepID=U4LJG8_PYROM|nr:Protein of unknown function [Pyronema omphalodes CBS 100304]
MSPEMSYGTVDSFAGDIPTSQLIAQDEWKPRWYKF